MEVIENLRKLFHKHVQVVSNTVCAFFGATSIACALGIWFSGGDMFIIAPVGLIGALAAAVAWWYAPDLSTRAKMAWMATSILLFILEILGIYWHFHQQTAGVQANSSPAPENLDHKIDLKCNHFMGAIPASPEREPRIVILHGAYKPPRSLAWETRVDVARLVNLAHNPLPPGAFAESNAVCVFSNDSNVSLLDSRVAISVNWKSIKNDGDRIYPGDARGSRYNSVLVDHMGSILDKQAEVFIVNYGPTFAEIQLPNVIFIKRNALSTPELVKLNLVDGSTTLLLYPPLGISINPQSAPPPVPAPLQQP